MNRVLLLLLLAAMFLWLLWPRPSTRIDSKNPNVVSLIEDTPSKQKKGSNNKEKTQTESVIIPEVVLSEDPMLTKASDELSYVDVYRMKRMYEMCDDAIYAAQEDENYDPVARFESMANHFIKDHPTWPTNKQVEAIQRHAIICEALLYQIKSLDLPQNKTNHDNPFSYIELREKIDQALSIMKPDSVKAQNIADTLKLIEIWNQHYDQVLQLSIGDETQNASEIEAIKAQIEQIRTEQQEISSQMQQQFNDAELSKQYAQTWQEIRQLERKITELRLIDPAARNQSIASFEAVNNQLFEKLTSSDPDVFYEAQMALEKNTNKEIYNFGHQPYKDIGKGRYKMPFIEYVSPGDVIKNITGQSDNQVFALIINYATQLYHCELGADCGADSEWVSFYCIKPTTNMNPDGCDLDLPTFYQQHLLNQNHWQDVQSTLDVLRGMYAQ